MKNKIIITVALLVFAVLFIPAAHAQTKENIAVADFSGRNMSAAEAAAISDFFRAALVNTGSYNVLDRSNMEMIVNEQKFQMTGCTEQDCAVKLGKILNVQKMAVGTVTLFDKTYYISAQVINVEKGVIEVSEKTSTQNKSELPKEAEDLARKLVKAAPKAEAGKTPPETSVPQATGQQKAIPVQGITGTTPFQLSILPQLRTPLSANVMGLGIGLASRNNRVYGVNAEYFYSRVNDTMAGIKGSAYNAVDGTMMGVQVGIYSTAGTLKGVQYDLVSHARNVYGVQAGYVNIAGTLNGIQIGFLNYTRYLRGVQVGFLNIATKSTFLPAMVFVNIAF